MSTVEQLSQELKSWKQKFYALQKDQNILEQEYKDNLRNSKNLEKCFEQSQLENKKFMNIERDLEIRSDNLRESTEIMSKMKKHFDKLLTYQNEILSEVQESEETESVKFKIEQQQVKIEQLIQSYDEKLG